MHIFKFSAGDLRTSLCMLSFVQESDVIVKPQATGAVLHCWSTGNSAFDLSRHCKLQLDLSITCPIFKLCRHAMTLTTGWQPWLFIMKR